MILRHLEFHLRPPRVVYTKMVRSCDLQCEGVCDKLTIIKGQVLQIITVTFLSQVTYSGNLVQTELPIEWKPNQITLAEPCCLHVTAPLSHIWENKHSRVLVSKVLFFMPPCKP